MASYVSSAAIEKSKTPPDWRVIFAGKEYTAPSKKMLVEQLLEDYHKSRTTLHVGGEFDEIKSDCWSPWCKGELEEWLEAFHAGDYETCFTMPKHSQTIDYHSGVYMADVPPNGDCLFYCMVYFVSLLVKDEDSGDMVLMEDYVEQIAALHTYYKNTVRDFNFIKSGNTPILINFCRTLGLNLVMDTKRSKPSGKMTSGIYVTVDTKLGVAHCQLIRAQTSPRYSLEDVYKAIGSTPK